MSGICGGIRLDREHDTSSILNKLMFWNEPYGDMEDSTFQKDKCFLGCCIENISQDDLHCSSVLQDKNLLGVIDAVLYNRKELIQQYRLNNNLSDEEIVFSLIQDNGYDCLKDINGDFAGAIYDTERESLTLFRDHLGVRPLFYYAKSGNVLFSTDIRGILSVEELDIKVSLDWLYRVCMGYSTQDLTHTEYEDVLCVKQGTYITLTFEDAVLTSKEVSYWKLGTKKIRLNSQQEYQERLKELITDSVQRRLDVTKGPVGAELSGGLDSGVIDILINQLGREGIYHSWSVDPSIRPLVEHDERLVVMDICQQEKISCHYVGEDMHIGMDCKMAQKMQSMGIPMTEEENIGVRYVFPPYMNTVPLMETAEYVASQGGKVVFTGHGGDEGVSHRNNLYELFYYKEYMHFIHNVWLMTKGRKSRVYALLKDTIKTIRQGKNYFQKPFRMPFFASDILKKEIVNSYSEADMPIVYFAFDPIKYIEAGCSRNRLDNIAVYGAYNGVRYMVPYLDYRVIDFAVSIPRYLYRNGKTDRYIFRETFKDIMPQSLYNQVLKSSPSEDNKDDDKSNEKYLLERKKVYSHLNREYWEKYLDFKVIDEWILKDITSEEERDQDFGTYYCLSLCDMAYSVLQKARESTKGL